MAQKKVFWRAGVLTETRETERGKEGRRQSGVGGNSDRDIEILVQNHYAHDIAHSFLKK